MSATTDISQLLAGLGVALERALAAAVRGLDVAGEHVIGDSAQLAPKLTTFLAASGTTLPAEVKGGSIEKTIGHNADYAAAVHERLDVHHDNGQAKFLETAVRNNAPKVGGFIADEVRKVL